MSDTFDEIMKAGEASEHDKKLRRKILSKYISDDEINKIEIEERVNNLELLQQKLKDNMDMAVEIANKNIIRNEQGHVMISKNDEWLNDTEYDEIIEK